MFARRALRLILQDCSKCHRTPSLGSSRPATTTSTGEVLPMPHITRFGLLGIACAVIPGLLIGATISKKMANFLEENELFVPSDDDDDDD